MRSIFFLICSGLYSAVLLVPLCSAEEQILSKPKDKVNYAIGVEIARNYRNQGLEIDPDLVLRGIRDALSGGNLLLPEKELRNILISVQSEIRRKQLTPKRQAAVDGPKGVATGKQ